MTLILCPECGHENSPQAAACPNCGRPLNAPAPVVEKKVIVPTPIPPREEGFPTWALIPIGLLALILVIVLYMAFRQTDDSANTNVNVNVARRTTTEPIRRETTDVPSSTDTTVTVPGQTTTVPGTSTSAPVQPPDKGSAVINARIATVRGPVQPGKNIKFYLLDKDLETILSEAGVSPIEGNTLPASLGLAAVYPDRYGDFQRAAIKAIGGHVKYSGSTGGDGTANLAGVEPKQYYLYGITRVGRGFALWNSPVSIIAGENVLNLSPQNVVEIPDA